MGTSLYERYQAEQEDPKKPKPVSQPSPASLYEKYQAEQQTPATNHGSSGTWGDAPDAADESTLGNLSRAVLNGATLGAGNKLIAAGNAAVDKLHGDNFGDAYRSRLAAERQASSNFSAQHPLVNGGLEVAGGLGSLIASGGASAPSEVAAAGRFAKLAHAAATGFDLGAAAGVVNADGGASDRARAAITSGVAGGVGGAVLEPAVATAGYVGRKLRLPELASSLADRASNALPVGSTAQRALASLSQSVGPKGQAASEIAPYLKMDAAAGHTPPSLPSSFPALAIDRAGPNVQGLAENIANRPGAGGAVIRNSLDARQAQMRPMVGRAFDEATGTNAAQGEQLIQRLADEHAAIDNTAGVAKAVAQESRSAKPATTTTQPIDAWRDQMGGSLSNGLQQLRQMVADQSSEAKRLFGAARQATAGQPMQSETLDQIRQTPAGKAAYSWALAQKANRNSPLATVAGKEIVPAEMSSAEWATTQQRARDRGMPVPSFGQEADETVPDPETLHYMKQALAKMSRMGVHDGAQGTLATQAQGALQQWGAIRTQMPEVWQQADEAFATKARTIDAFNMGRNLMRTQANPAGTARQALAKSLDGVEQAFAAMSPTEQQAFRAGGQSAVTEFLHGGAPTAGLVKQLQDPASPMSRRLALATGDASAPAQFGARITPQVQPQQIPGAPPVPALSSSARAAAQGFDVLGYRTSPRGATPERSLSQYAQTAAALPPVDRRQLQQGAAQALRGEFAGASGTLKAPGRVFDFGSPERAQQMAYAFPDHNAAAGFQNTVGAWDAASRLRDQIAGNSATARRGAGELFRDTTTPSMVNELVTGHPVNAVKALVSGANREATSATRQAMDFEIARVLSSNDPSALSMAERSAAFRQRLQELLGPSAGVAGATLTANRY